MLAAMANTSRRGRGGNALAPVERAHSKTDEDFITDCLCPSDSSWTKWTHPGTREEYSLSLAGPSRLSRADLKACFDLVEETSRADYEPSSAGWDAEHKMREMESVNLRYVVVRNAAGSIRAFASMMPTHESGEQVVYCYEIHLKPELRGTGLGRILMSLAETVAAHIPGTDKVMLTCFLSNRRGLKFYKKLGFVTDPSSPRPRYLRSGRRAVPDYVVLSKLVGRGTV